MEHEDVRALVSAHATRYRAPVELAERIEDSLAFTSVRSRRTGPGFWQGLSVGTAMTAALALALGVGFLSMQPSRDDLLVDEVVANHVRALQDDHVLDVASSDQHTVKPWFNGKLDYAAPVRDFAQDGFVLAGGRLDYFDQRPVAALVYKHNLHTFNVFVLPAKDGASTVPAQALNRQGFAVEHWTRDGMAYWAVSDAEAPTVAHLASLLGAQGAAR